LASIIFDSFDFPHSLRYFPQIVFHPGETLSEKLDEMNMGPKKFAVRTGK
jgi:hypothetical protein